MERSEFWEEAADSEEYAEYVKLEKELNNPENIGKKEAAELLKQAEKLKESPELHEILKERKRIIERYLQALLDLPRDANFDVYDAIQRVSRTLADKKNSQDLRELKKLNERSKFIRYRHLGGEVEARNEAKRGDMDIRDRLSTLLETTQDVPNDERIASGGGLSGNIRYSINPAPYYQIPFADSVDNLVKKGSTSRSPVFVSETPEIFREIGFPALPFIMNARHLQLNYHNKQDFIKNHGRLRKNEHTHALGDSIKDLPEALKHPLAVLVNYGQSAKADSVVAIIELQGKNEKCIAPVLIETTGMIDGQEIDAHLVLTVYDPKDWAQEYLTKAIEAEEKGDVGIFFFDEAKIKDYFSKMAKTG